MKSTVRAAVGWTTLVSMLASLYMIFEWVPTEEDQGIVQRIFYFHVPCAWVAFAAFALVAICGIFYLWLGQQVWDDLGYAAAETITAFVEIDFSFQPAALEIAVNELRVGNDLQVG